MARTKEEKQEYNKLYSKNNRKEILEREREYLKNLPEEEKTRRGENKREYDKQYRIKNHRKICEQEKFYRIKNKPKMKEYMKQYYKNNKVKWEPSVSGKEKIKIRVTQLRNQRRDVVLAFYGGNNPTCACCGEPHKEFLTIDHIGGGGCKHIKEIKTDIYRWLIKNNFPPGFRIFCWNCNCATRFGKPCPHEIERQQKQEAS